MNFACANFPLADSARFGCWEAFSTHLSLGLEVGGQRLDELVGVAVLQARAWGRKGVSNTDSELLVPPDEYRRILHAATAIQTIGHMIMKTKRRGKPPGLRSRARDAAKGRGWWPSPHGEREAQPKGNIYVP